MVNNSPLVSVLITCFNSEKFIEETIKSVLNQTFKDFEIVIVDDASTDSSIKIIQSFDDARIRLIRNNENLKISKARNIGIRESKGHYIAILDSDDLSHKRRLELQVNFLNANSEIGILGSRYQCFGASSGRVRKYTNNEHLKAYLLFGSCFGHSTVMFRKYLVEDMNEPYSSNLFFAEDYDLFVRLATRTKFALLEDYLVKYRIHSKSITFNDSGKKYYGEIKVLESVFEKFFGLKNKTLTEDFRNRGELDFQQLVIVTQRILSALNENAPFSKKSLNKVYFDNWLHIYCVNRKIKETLPRLKYYFSFPGKIPINIVSMLRTIKFFLR